MSLINDALRRKNQDNKTAAPEKSDGAPMEAVQPAARSNASYLAPILIVLIVLVLAMAAMLFWKGFQTKKELAAANDRDSQMLLPKDIEDRFSDVKTVQTPTPVAPTQPSAVVTAAVEPANTNSAAANATNVPVAPPVSPPVKLQGIFYRITNPTAMINGKTVSVGESTSGIRVLKIERQHVTVEHDGKQEVLTLE